MGIGTNLEAREAQRVHRGGQSFVSVAEVARDLGYHENSVRRKARDPNDPFPVLVRIGPNKTALVREAYEAWKRSVIEAAEARGASAVA